GHAGAREGPLLSRGHATLGALRARASALHQSWTQSERIFGYDSASMTPDPNERPSPGPFGAIAKLFRKPAGPQPEQEASKAGAERSPRNRGKYGIPREVGGGGMGIVYSARDRDLDRAVAIKVISRSGPAVAGNDDSRKRFLREARAAASVNHPNICLIY